MKKTSEMLVKPETISLASLCTGYGGLDMAAQAVFGGKLAWCADNDKHVVRILAARYPTVRNLGDLTLLDWSQVPLADIICAGFPCQDISSSGKRLGIEKGERSGIWKNIVEGIRYLRPSVIIVENVSAIRSNGLSRVLGNLASLGYDTCWTSLRASDIGAPHRRERVFILGYSKEDKTTKARALLTAAYARSQRWQRWTTSSQAQSRWPSSRSGRLGHLACARLCQQAQGCPAPNSPRQRRDQGLSQAEEQQWEAITPLSHDRTGQASSVGKIAWGRYEAAIRRWETLTGRSAPHQVQPGTKGQPRLAPAFSEWLMGLPNGFVTDLGLPYSAQHRAIGNGVVPQQAVRALWELVEAVVESMPVGKETARTI